ncbi:MAG: DsrE family protein [Dehalococcoidia bacterium]|nr:DsrE family protein [Dehalococcoidia bacterium]
MAEDLGHDFEVKFLPVYASKEAEELGVDVAPALAVNRRIIKEGVPTKEEILDMIERARPINLGIIVTKAPIGSEDAENALEAGRQALLAGDTVGLFLLSDGVWLAKRGKADALEAKLAEFITLGGKVVASGQHLRAVGLGADRLVEKVDIADDGLGRLVDLVMDEWDKTIIL